MKRQRQRLKEEKEKRLITLSIRFSEIEYDRLTMESKARGNAPLALIIRDGIVPILTGETAKQREAGI